MFDDVRFAEGARCLICAGRRLRGPERKVRWAGAHLRQTAATTPDGVTARLCRSRHGGGRVMFAMDGRVCRSAARRQGRPRRAPVKGLVTFCLAVSGLRPNNSPSSLLALCNTPASPTHPLSDAHLDCPVRSRNPCDPRPPLLPTDATLRKPMN